MSGGGKKYRPIRDRRGGRVSGNSPSRNSLPVEDSRRRFVRDGRTEARGDLFPYVSRQSILIVQRP